ncbi:poly(ethylene terephthalate) hydrolase family protein [Streptomyces sp. URMC 129]|uniref:poly(ethylene terephthalate) hydrolase family protein n=1 Tax=Streptomyces sp. URMC 129 TaxID=3423407 RepID=UPI003F1D937D
MAGTTRRTLLTAALGLSGFTGALGLTGVGHASTAYAVESWYARSGPHGVVLSGLPGYALYRPQDLGGDGLRHPVLTWGNGTGARPATYTALLAHLASWGFVVIAADSGATGQGTEMLAGARHLVVANDDPGSVFHDRIDTRRIGALGHSQGAGGAVNAAVAADGLITAALCVALPDERWVADRDTFRLERLACPVLLLGGEDDLIAAPPAAQRRYFDRVPGPAAVGVLRHADHTTIEHDGGGFRGYLTAWFMYLLRAEQWAGTAFVGGVSEFLVNSHWRDQAVK